MGVWFSKAVMTAAWSVTDALEESAASPPWCESNSPTVRWADNAGHKRATAVSGHNPWVHNACNTQAAAGPLLAEYTGARVAGVHATSRCLVVHPPARLTTSTPSTYRATAAPNSSPDAI